MLAELENWVEKDFTPDAINEIAKLAAEVNGSVENIGARRLHTLLERLLETISFDASEKPDTAVTIDAPYVRERLSDFATNVDLSKFVL